MEIEVLKMRGFSLGRIVAEVGCAVNTVRRHLAARTKRKYERQRGRVAKLWLDETYLRERQVAAHPDWIPATVLQREIAAQGYQGGTSQLRAFLRGIRPTLPVDPVVRFETAPGEQMQVDWVEFRKGLTERSGRAGGLATDSNSALCEAFHKADFQFLDGYQRGKTDLAGEKSVEKSIRQICFNFT